MKILVPVKRVLDPYAKPRPLPDGSGIDTSGLKFEINPFDEIAVEEAVRQKEKNPEIEVTVVSIGGGECEEQLRKALAIGADRAVLVETSATLDSPGIANELAALAKELTPDLILMGKQATDDDNNQAAQMLAAKLDWPQATFASKIIIEENQISVIRETDSGEETLTMGLPAVVTADLRLNEPRYIALPGIIKARSKPLDKRTASAASSPKTRTIRVEAPAPRAPGRKVANVGELVAALKERGVL
jgi:electron transfer flavoprotein beta subunit